MDPTTTIVPEPEDTLAIEHKAGKTHFCNLKKQSFDKYSNVKSNK